MSRLTALALVLAVSLASSAASQEAVPFEFELPVQPVDLELYSCRLDVTIESGVQPLLRGFASEGSTGATPTFEVGTRGGQIRIVRTPIDEDSKPAWAVVELVLDPGQGIRVNGRDLAVSVTGPGPADHEPTQPQPDGQRDQTLQAPQPHLHSYQLTDSEASLFGVSVSSLVADNTAVHYERGWGTMTADLQWSELEVRNHQGSATVTAADSETVFESIEGDATFNHQRGAVIARNGDGTLQGTSTDGIVTVDYWEGTVTLTGTSTDYQVREVTTNLLKYVGTDSDLGLDGVEGDVNAQLTGGGASLGSVNGNLVLNAVEGAAASVEEHDGKVTVTLQEDSTAELETVSGEVLAKVFDSELDALAVEGLHLTTTNARVTAEVLKTIKDLKIKRSDVQLDLQRMDDRKLTVSVVDDSYVTVYVDAPCRVQARQSQDGGSGLSVSGCELQMEHTGRWKGKRRRTADGRPPFLLTAKVSPDGSLRIQGSP